MTERTRTDIGGEVKRHREDARAVWEMDRVGDALDAYTLARVYEDAFGDRWKDTGEPGTKNWWYAIGLYGLARLIVEHCWGVRAKSVWWLLRKSYLDDGREEGMRAFCEAIESGHFDEEKRALVAGLSRAEVGDAVRAKGRALEVHDAVWEAVEGELLSPVVAEMDRAEWARGRREQEEERRRKGRKSIYIPLAKVGQHPDAPSRPSMEEV